MDSFVILFFIVVIVCCFIKYIKWMYPCFKDQQRPVRPSIYTGESIPDGPYTPEYI